MAHGQFVKDRIYTLKQITNAEADMLVDYPAVQDPHPETLAGTPPSFSLQTLTRVTNHYDTNFHKSNRHPLLHRRNGHMARCSSTPAGLVLAYSTILP